MSSTEAKVESALKTAEWGLRELATFTRFCEASLSLAPLIVHIPKLIDYLTKDGAPPLSEAAKQVIEYDVESIKWGTGQEADYLPYLHGIAIVKTCSVLETAVDDVALALLSDRNYWPKLEGLAKLRANKVELLTLLQMSHTQQTTYLLAEIKKEVASSYQVGAGRYEAILNFVGLGGPIPEIVSRSLLELLETRHLLVHRRGVVDGKFVGRCPWRGVEVDQELKLSRLDFYVLFLSATWYLLEMQQRAANIHPGCKFDNSAEFKDNIVGDVAEFDRQRKETPPSADADFSSKLLQ
jgi:hypothetical protein